MEKKSSGSALPGVGLIAVAVALLIGISPPRKDGEKKAERAPTTAPAAPAETPVVRGLNLFLSQKRVADSATILGRTVYAPRPGNSFLVLTLPDPIDSQLGYWYDQSVDALTRALGHVSDDPRLCYVLTDRWFPWTVVSEDKANNAVTRSGDPKSEPGVIIYQRVGDAADRLVVLVVGENAITGLRVDALKLALDLAARAPAADEWTIPLVGPFCTGSQASLAQGVLEWDARRAELAWDDEPDGRRGPLVSCITGSALGLVPWEAIRPAESDRLGTLCGPITGTQAPFNLLNQAALHYLRSRNRPDAATLTTRLTVPPPGQLPPMPPGQVAYLVEANSGFGESAAGIVRVTGPGATRKAPLVFRFPMHIGRLAGIRSKEARERDVRLGLVRPGEGQLTALDEERTGGDLIPAADEKRTALINQRLLSDYWSAIRKEDVRYVWVVATDKRDTLFLVEQLRAACPDVLPVVFGADLHYVYPDYLRFMRGVVVVGTYPLYLPAQRWQADDGDPRRLPFPSSNAEGVYNAVLASLGSKERMADYRSPKLAPRGSNSPPIWVTTVGENGEFVPLAYFTEYADTTGYLVPALGGSDTLADPESPFGQPFFYLVGLIAAAALVGAWYVWHVDRKTGTAAADPARVWVPGLRAQYVLLAGIGGTFAALPLVLALRAAHAGSAPTADLLYGVALGVLVLIAGGTFCYVVWQARLTARHVRASRGTPPPAVVAPWQVAAFALLIAGVVFGWLLADHARLPESARVLFAERAASLFGGCSPVVPACVIAMGLLVYGLLGLQQLRLITGFRVAPPYPVWATNPPAGQELAAAAVGRIHEAVREIDIRLATLAGVFISPGTRTGTRWLRLAVWGAAGAFAAVAVIFAASRGPDGPSVLWSGGVAVAVASVVLCGLVLAFVWNWEGRSPLGRPRPHAWLLLIAGGAACVVALSRAQRTWESQAWNCLFATGFLSLAFLTLVGAYRLYLLWKQVEKITRAIAVVPMVAAFDRFPDKVVRVFGDYLLSRRSRSLDLAIPNHLLGLLRAGLDADPDPDAARAREALSATAAPPVDSDEMEGRQTDNLCAVAARLVTVLAPGWPRQCATDAFGTLPPEAGKEPEQPTDWRGLGEQFVAVMAVIFLSQFFVRMRYLAYAAVATATALVLAITAYQFEPEQFLMYTATGFAAAVIGLMVWLLFRINRNELVSRVTRGTPNRFQLDSAFVQNLTVFVLPLLAVVVTQLAGRMRSVVEPVLGWLR